MKRLILFFFALSTVAGKGVAAISMSGAEATIIYVDSSASAGGNGSSPVRAYRKLQDALTFAASKRGQIEIRVAKGTYFPDEGVGYTDNARDSAFVMLPNVSILGGYYPGFPSNKDRNWVINKTILSGDIQQTGSGNAYAVIHNKYTVGSQLTNAGLDGFIIENSLKERGLYNYYSSAVFRNCIFTKNKASRGGAVWNEYGAPQFINCLFYTNSASWGRNMRNVNSTVEIVNCTFAGTSSVVSNTSFFDSNGGAVNIRNSIVWGSTGPLEIYGSNPDPYHVENSIIQGGYAGSNVIGTDPRFLDPSYADFRLNVCSPAINSGDNSVNPETSDFDFTNRIKHGQIDMGAYEYETGVIYVNKNVSGGNEDGTSWADAFVHLQDALHELDVCGTPGEIWITNSTYYPDEGQFVTLNDRSETFTLLNKVNLFGGFLGAETGKSQRNPSLKTTLSGDLDNNDPFEDFSSNSYHVVSADFGNPDSSANSSLLDGFTIKGGNADGGGGSYSGGAALYFQDGTFTVNNCNIVENRASGGAGLWTENVDIEITESYFFDNRTTGPGGALSIDESKAVFSSVNFESNLSFLENLDFYLGSGGAGIIGHSDVEIDDCHFDNNTALIEAGALRMSGSTVTISNSTFGLNEGKKGGAINVTNSTLTIQNTSFSDNSVEGIYGLNPAYTQQHGGGIFAYNTTLMIENSSFERNRTENNGGAIYTLQSALSISNSQFSENEASFINTAPQGVSSYGAALFLDNGTISDIDQTVFHDNRAYDGGGAIFVNSDSTIVNNCIFYDNEDFTGTGGAIYVDEGKVLLLNSTISVVDLPAANASIILTINNQDFEIYNSILWSNATQEIQNNGAGGTVGNSIVSSGYLGGGVNISTANPEFVYPDTANFALKRCSPAINAGDSSKVLGSLDYEGSQRIQRNGPDLGAYESPYIFQTNCDCPDDMQLSGTQPAGTLRADESIELEGEVESGINLTLGANGSIELSPPLLIDSGSVFQAEMEGCQ